MAVQSRLASYKLIKKATKSTKTLNNVNIQASRYVNYNQGGSGVANYYQISSSIDFPKQHTKQEYGQGQGHGNNG